MTFTAATEGETVLAQSCWLFTLLTPPDSCSSR